MAKKIVLITGNIFPISIDSFLKKVGVIMFSKKLNLKQFGNFSNYNISSDGGVLLLDKVESKCNIISDASKLVKDIRNPLFITHSMISMMKQLIYGIAMGYSDLNDHEFVRLDHLYKSVLDKKEDLASDSTLCRMEKHIDNKTIIDLNKLLVEQFISNYKSPPKEIILDIDWTDVELYGNQEERYYHGYYKEYCYIPLHVTCGDELLVSYLRPANKDGFRHSWAIIGLLIKRLRQSFPDVRIIIRADSGFMRHKFLGWLELKGVEYIIGMAKNSRLVSYLSEEIDKVNDLYQQSNNHETISYYKYLSYSASSWRKERRILSKIERNYHGRNTRFVVSNISGDISASSLYKDMYCMRGDMENKIKYVQLDMFGDRMSSSRYLSNSFRLMLSSLAYTLIQKLKRYYLTNTNLAKATANTIRLRLLKIAVLIKVRKTSIRFEFTANYAYRDLFMKIMPKLFAT